MGINPLGIFGGGNSSASSGDTSNLDARDLVKAMDKPDMSQTNFAALGVDPTQLSPKLLKDMGMDPSAMGLGNDSFSPASQSPLSLDGGKSSQTNPLKDIIGTLLPMFKPFLSFLG